MTSPAQLPHAADSAHIVDTLSSARIPAGAAHTDYIVSVRGAQVWGVLLGMLAVGLAIGFAAGWWMRGRRGT